MEQKAGRPVVKDEVMRRQQQCVLIWPELDEMSAQTGLLWQIKRLAHFFLIDFLELRVSLYVLDVRENGNRDIDRSFGQYNLHQFGIQQSEDGAQDLMSGLEVVNGAAQGFVVEITFNLQKQRQIVNGIV